jgi:hypothetical protein
LDKSAKIAVIPIAKMVIPTMSSTRVNHLWECL